MPKDYEIGYGKPPKHTRFQPGQSGNPKGRPRRSRNLKTLFNLERLAMVTVREAGREHRVTKLHALVMALFAKAMRADTKAVGQIIQLDERLGNDQDDAVSGQPLTDEEQEVLDSLAQRFLAPATQTEDDEKAPKKRSRGGKRR